MLNKEIIKEMKDEIISKGWEDYPELQGEIFSSCEGNEFFEILLTSEPSDWSYLDIDGINVIQTENGVVYNKTRIS